jgi:nitrite reductase/ring-hydroxylating ferredoxin subunit
MMAAMSSFIADHFMAPDATTRACNISAMAEVSGPFVSVARVGGIPPGTARQVTVGGRRVAIFHIDDAYHAIDNLCLHRGGPLCEGAVGGHVVTCPWHGWQFDVRTGELVQDPAVGVSRHDTRIVGDEIQVRLTD